MQKRSGPLARAAREDRVLDEHSFGRADGEGGTVRLSLCGTIRQRPGFSISVAGLFRGSKLPKPAQKGMGTARGVLLPGDRLTRDGWFASAVRHAGAIGTRHRRPYRRD